MRQIDKEGDTSNIELSNPNKSYVDLTKEIQQEFVRVLKDKIQNEGESNNDNESEVDFGIDMMENYVRVLKGNIKSKYS